MVNESFGEMRRLPGFSGTKLGAAITTIAWDALREQIETPPVIGHRDGLLMRIKAYIEAKLADPELSVERIAHANGISVRGLHRHFAEDPAGSVSRYLWQRRLIRCAEVLQEHQPGASLDNRGLLVIRLQQFVAFQPAVQGSVRSSAGFLSRRADQPPSGDPG